MKKHMQTHTKNVALKNSIEKTAWTGDLKIKTQIWLNLVKSPNLSYLRQFQIISQHGPHTYHLVQTILLVLTNN